MNFSYAAGAGNGKRLVTANPAGACQQAVVDFMFAAKAVSRNTLPIHTAAVLCSKIEQGPVAFLLRFVRRMPSNLGIRRPCHRLDGHSGRAGLLTGMA